MKRTVRPGVALVAVAVGLVVACLCTLPGLSYPLWIATYNHAQVQQSRAERIQFLIDQLSGHEEKVPSDVLNRWLSNKLTLDDQKAYRGMSADDKCEPDAWRRPFLAVRDRKLADGSVVPIGIYSLGEDGKSATEGEDSDDTNTWDRNTGQTYRQREVWQARLHFLVFAVPTTIAAYVLISVFLDRRKQFDASQTYEST